MEKVGNRTETWRLHHRLCERKRHQTSLTGTEILKVTSAFWFQDERLRAN